MPTKEELLKMAEIIDDSEMVLFEHIKENKAQHSEIKEDIKDLEGEIIDTFKAVDKSIKEIELTPGEKGERGNKFIGRFKTVDELPEIDNINVIKGDWAFVDDTGEIWYT